MGTLSNDVIAYIAAVSDTPEQICAMSATCRGWREIVRDGVATAWRGIGHHGWGTAAVGFWRAVDSADADGLRTAVADVVNARVTDVHRERDAAAIICEWIIIGPKHEHRVYGIPLMRYGGSPKPERTEPVWNQEEQYVMYPVTRPVGDPTMIFAASVMVAGLFIGSIRLVRAAVRFRRDVTHYLDAFDSREAAITGGSSTVLNWVLAVMDRRYTPMLDEAWKRLATRDADNIRAWPDLSSGQPLPSRKRALPDGPNMWYVSRYLSGCQATCEVWFAVNAVVAALSGRMELVELLVATPEVTRRGHATNLLSRILRESGVLVCDIVRELSAKTRGIHVDRLELWFTDMYTIRFTRVGVDWLPMRDYRVTAWPIIQACAHVGARGLAGYCVRKWCRQFGGGPNDMVVASGDTVRPMFGWLGQMIHA
jgi:hypothetical protein